MACGFALIQVSGPFLFDEPDTVCIDFFNCSEHGEQAWNMVRLMCNQPNFTTRDRDEADLGKCLHSRVLRHLVPLWNSRGIPGLTKMAMSARSGATSLVSNRSHITPVFISCHVCILLPVHSLQSVNMSCACEHCLSLLLFSRQ